MGNMAQRRPENKMKNQERKREGIKGWIRKFLKDMEKESISSYEGKPFDCCQVPENGRKNGRKD